MKKLWTREEIDALLIENDVAVMRAICRLYEMQTQHEQSSARTDTKNNVGFSACDAKAGTRMARWLLGLNDRNEKRYQPKSLLHPKCQAILGRYAQGGRVIDRARKIAMKHSRQLVRLANG